MSVVAFPGVNLNDVPGMLRALADQMATGEYGEVRGVAYAFITEDSDLYCNLMGRISQVEGVGVFTMAATMMQIEEDE